MRNSFFILLSFLFCSVVCVPIVSAYVASSTNYVIEADSVNSGGGLSVSPSYSIEDTVGESGVGASASASYAVKAGYQQMRDVYLSVTLPGNVTLLPNIPSVGGGIADGTTGVTVTTDNLSGYAMTIRASTSPALASGGDSFADYVPLGAFPDLSFVTPPASSRFGFTPEGSDIISSFRDNGVLCGVGGGDTPSACWQGLSTAPLSVVSRATPNHPTGSLTTLRFRAQADAAYVQPAGSYQAVVSLTVMAL
jgi:hypothetical protein